MKFLVHLSFDLHGADSEDYRELDEALARNSLRKSIRTANGISPLPANTYLCVCTENLTPLEIARDLKGNITETLSLLGLSGDFFVVVCEKWACEIGGTRPPRPSQAKAFSAAYPNLLKRLKKSLS